MTRTFTRCLLNTPNWSPHDPLARVGVSRPSTKKSLTAALDKEFSKQVRVDGKCEWCGKTCSGVYLHCAHIVSRSNRRLRWDRMNAVALCPTCHREAHNHPVGFSEWLKGKYPAQWKYVQNHRNEKIKRSLQDLKDLLAELKSAA